MNSDDTTYTSDFVINKWKHQDAIPSSDFCYREPILSQRIQIFKTAGVRAKRKIESIFGIDEGIQEMVLNLAVECRQEGAHALAVRRLAELESMSLSHEMRVGTFHIFSPQEKININCLIISSQKQTWRLLSCIGVAAIVKRQRL